MRNRIIGFALWVLALALAFWSPISKSVLLSDYSSHVVLVPFIAAYLFWKDRHAIFSSISYGPNVFVIYAGLGIASVLLALFYAPNHASSLIPFLVVLSALLLAAAGFVLFFGPRALRTGMFPFLFLALMLPIPAFLLDRIIYFLQSGSADLSTALFSILGVPVLRNGFLLTIPGVTVEVAKECSGINSTVALFIVMVLVAHETLKTNVRRAVLVFLILPLSILKNAIRIVTLTLLATKVDPDFLTGRLHHQGGFVFFLIMLGIAYPIWKLLRDSELRTTKADTHSVMAPASERS